MTFNPLHFVHSPRDVFALVLMLAFVSLGWVNFWKCTRDYAAGVRAFGTLRGLACGAGIIWMAGYIVDIWRSRSASTFWISGGIVLLLFQIVALFAPKIVKLWDSGTGLWLLQMANLLFLLVFVYWFVMLLSWIIYKLDTISFHIVPGILTGLAVLAIGYSWFNNKDKGIVERRFRGRRTKD